VVGRVLKSTKQLSVLHKQERDRRIVDSIVHVALHNLEELAPQNLVLLFWAMGSGDLRFLGVMPSINSFCNSLPNGAHTSHNTS
jgi:hypothetical protein